LNLNVVIASNACQLRQLWPESVFGSLWHPIPNKASYLEYSGPVYIL
jgi:hypothetical protein